MKLRSPWSAVPEMPLRPKRRLFVTAVSVGLAFALAACGGPSAKPNSSRAPFLLGIAMPLTGSEAQYGVGLKTADQAAVTYINNHGGILGHPIKALYWDTKAEPAVGVAGTDYFISHGVNAVVGYFDSDVTIPSVKILEQHGIPLFGGNPSAPSLVKMGLSNFVRITGNSKNSGLVQAEFAYKELQLRRAVVVDDNESFGDAYAKAFTDAFKALGGTVQATYTTETTTTDFGSVLSEIKSLTPAPQILEYSGFDPGAALILKQAREAGLALKYITDSSQYGPTFISDAGTAAVGAYMTNHLLPKAVSGAAKYFDSTVPKDDINPINADTYDAVFAVLHSAELAHSISPKALLETMHKVSFQGATGQVSFLPDGDRAQVLYDVVQVTPAKTYKQVYTYSKTLG